MRIRAVRIGVRFPHATGGVNMLNTLKTKTTRRAIAPPTKPRPAKPQPTITKLYADFAKLYAAIKAEKEQSKYEPLLERCNRIAERIVVMPANCLDEVKKVRIAFWASAQFSYKRLEEFDDHQPGGNGEEFDALLSLRDDFRRKATAEIEADTSDSTSDARLLQLGEQLDAAWAEASRMGVELDAKDQASGTNEDSPDYDKAMDRVGVIVDQIRDIPAQTIAGLRVKARAVLWCHSGEPWAQSNEPRIDLSPFAAKTTDFQLVESILANLLRGTKNPDLRSTVLLPRRR
jgi:hypothetical protein